MPAGRPPKPTKLKQIQGTNQPCRDNPNEPNPPKPDNKPPKPPKWLSRKGKWAYRELAEQLDGMRVLTLADWMALELLCDAYAEYREAREVVQAEGMTYETYNKNGGLQVKTRPEVSISSDAWRRVQRMLSEFGLTPSSRSKVSAIEEKEIDPVQALMDREKSRGK